MFIDFLKIFLLIYTGILTPIYLQSYGLQNFLWLSDIGLFLTTLGLWLNSNLLISIAAVGVFFVETFWNIDFFVYLIFKVKLTSLSEYMFKPKYPLFLRLLSLFHVFMPLIWIWYITQYSYDTRAFNITTILYWIILFFVYFFTDPKENINWVFLPKNYNSLKSVPDSLWVLILAIFFPLFIFYPTHYLFSKISG